MGASICVFPHVLARATAATPWGIEARPVHVEVDIAYGLPQFHLVGLPDAAVRESRVRVRSAIKNCGFDLPSRAVIINLAPADLRKEGNHLDLAIAVAMLGAFDLLPSASLEGRLLCGELGLDGSLRPVRGGLALAGLTHALELDELILPAENAAEAAALGTTTVHGARSLADVIEHLTGVRSLAAAIFAPAGEGQGPHHGDLSEVGGQEVAKRALEIAAAGAHNLLLIGPPGCGKTMLASRLPTILPALSRTDSITITKIHALAASEPPRGLIGRRPFRSPHSTTTTAGMIGGGSIVRPGEVSLAHAGVLFLDELPEFGRRTLEALRQPMEDGRVSLVRARSRFTFPARFSLLAAMNPCPCGYLADSRKTCRCSPVQVAGYRARISGPLLDRIDLHVEVAAPEYATLSSGEGEGSAEIATRVRRVRDLQQARFATLSRVSTNAAMTPELLRRYCRLDADGRRLLRRVYEQLGLSVRALHRIQKVARTISDMAGEESVSSDHIAEAIQYRALDRPLEE